MKIGILSYKPFKKQATEEERKLKHAAEALSHKAQIFRAERCQLVYDGRGERVFYNQKRFPQIDVLIPRASIINNVDIRLSLVKQFQLMGIPVVNDYMAIARAKNKLRTMQILHSMGIPTPRTVVIDNFAGLDMAIDKVGGAPVILKDPFGTYGNGVVIAESKRGARSMLDAMWKGNVRSIMVQEYIGESEGRDTRVFVVGGEVVASMERCAQAEEFRSNVELGGEARAVTVSDKYAQIAIASANALNLDVAGVDIIETKNGPAVLEVNGNPGFKTLEKVTEIDVATSIIKLAERIVVAEI
ncbi:RimK family alpha-L-glutamate ligase [Patescibacteria group bacterium]|nr:RimK family alpha-L-glutamate ligase [Patescibacteria group bacterium]